MLKKHGLINCYFKITYCMECKREEFWYEGKNYDYKIMHCIIMTWILSVLFFFIFSSFRAVVRCMLCIFGVWFGWDSWWWRGLFVLTNIHIDWHCISRIFCFPTNDPYLIPLFLFPHSYLFYLTNSVHASSQNLYIYLFIYNTRWYPSASGK